MTLAQTAAQREAEDGYRQILAEKEALIVSQAARIRELEEAGKTPEVLRLIARAEAAEAALAKRDEEVAELRAALRSAETDLIVLSCKVEDAHESDPAWQKIIGMAKGRIEKIADTLTKEPTNAECKQDAGESIATAIRARGET